jgi:hypothetical protein
VIALIYIKSHVLYLKVFTSAAASGILTNDLVSIMETTDVTGIEADTIDDNIFQWNVRVKNFAANWYDTFVVDW